MCWKSLCFITNYNWHHLWLSNKLGALEPNTLSSSHLHNDCQLLQGNYFVHKMQTSYYKRFHKQYFFVFNSELGLTQKLDAYNQITCGNTTTSNPDNTKLMSEKYDITAHYCFSQHPCPSEHKSSVWLTRTITDGRLNLYLDL